jgi:hypothetical protein
MPAEILRRPEVDLFPSQHRCQLVLHRGQAEQARLMAGLALHQQVDVTVGPCSTRKGGAEQGKATDVLFLAAGGEKVLEPLGCTMLTGLRQRPRRALALTPGRRGSPDARQQRSEQKRPSSSLSKVE